MRTMLGTAEMADLAQSQAQDAVAGNTESTVKEGDLRAHTEVDFSADGDMLWEGLIQCVHSQTFTLQEFATQVLNCISKTRHMQRAGTP